MAALDDVDGVNLQVAQVRHRCRRGLWAGAEGFGGVQALGMQPDSAGLDGGELERILQSGSLVFRYWFPRRELIREISQYPWLVFSKLAFSRCFVLAVRFVFPSSDGSNRLADFHSRSKS